MNIFLYSMAFLILENFQISHSFLIHGLLKFANNFLFHQIVYRKNRKKSHNISRELYIEMPHTFAKEIHCFTKLFVRSFIKPRAMVQTCQTTSCSPKPRSTREQLVFLSIFFFPVLCNNNRAHPITKTTKTKKPRPNLDKALFIY